jgi:hypothetical protein
MAPADWDARFMIFPVAERFCRAMFSRFPVFLVPDADPRQAVEQFFHAARGTGKAIKNSFVHPLLSRFSGKPARRFQENST